MPYFINYQKELAILIAHIVLLNKNIPKSIITSLPSMPDKTFRVDRKLSQLRGANQNTTHQRSIVLPSSPASVASVTMSKAALSSPNLASRPSRRSIWRLSRRRRLCGGPRRVLWGLQICSIEVEVAYTIEKKSGGEIWRIICFLFTRP
ncbi:hypothetical protein BU16DRAFT_115950 [Lophium mytilinum]|uniref:Uncharacterized protein n=1 Tax=Lophium mytilinum TaxID=390894 RepID=A0A6A6QGY3_9PEZI|nr:hypothetical protein BU16DRAFT_115950 [Lophium mytilinum]